MPVDLQVEEKLWSVPAPMEKITMGYSAQILYPILSFCVCGALCFSKAVYDSYDEHTHPFSDGFIDEKTVEAIRNDAIEMYDELWV